MVDAETGVETFNNYIGGQWVASTSGDTLPDIRC